MDTLAIVVSRAVPVGKAEFINMPLLGKIGRFMQVGYHYYSINQQIN